MARMANGIAITALTATTMTGASRNTSPKRRSRMNQPAPMTIGGTTSTKPAPVSASSPETPRAARAVGKRAPGAPPTSDSDRATASSAASDGKDKAGGGGPQDGRFADQAAEIGVAARQATVASIGPATKSSGQPMIERIEARVAARACSRGRGGATDRSASPVDVGAEPRSSANRRTPSAAICSSVSATARAGSKSKRNA